MKETPIEQEFTRSGWTFTQIEQNEHGYIYQVNDGEHTFYEVFEKRRTPICIDFKNRIYSTTEYKDRYPGNEDFGKWAWTYATITKAKEKLDYFTNKLSTHEQDNT